MMCIETASWHYTQLASSKDSRTLSPLTQNTDLSAKYGAPSCSTGAARVSAPRHIARMRAQCPHPCTTWPISPDPKEPMDSPSRTQRLAALAHKNRRVLIVAVCAVVFIMLLEDVLEGELIKLDALAYQALVEWLRADWLTPLIESVSALASPVVLLALLLIVVAFAPGKRPGLCCAVNLVLVVALNLLLKSIVQRPRPEGFNLVMETGFSFPSGHSMVAMAFFGLLVWLVWRYHPKGALRNGCCIGFGLVIVLIGVSRVYLGVHYASDVVAGFCVALAWLAVYTRTLAPLILDPARTNQHDKESDTRALSISGGESENRA